MALGQADVDALENESSGSGSSSSSSGSYPKFEERVPQASITCDEDGNWEFHTYPEGPTLTYKKRRSNASWELHYTPSSIKKYWWERVNFLRQVEKVDKHFDADLWEVVKDNPERAADLINEAAKASSGEHRVSKTRTCAVCDTELHTVTDDFRKIGKRVVCTRHNVAELHSAGLLD